MKAKKSANKWDVFISHASEDKDSFVRPLAVSLQQLGVKVWFDVFSLRLGDSLSRSIDHGLANSKFGIVVISPNFIGKAWPERELAGLVSREIAQGRVIIPIWHNVTRAQVLRFSPTLADKVAARSDNLPAQDLAVQILREIRPDLYKKHPRAELERLASGGAPKALLEKLEQANETLAEFKCRYCGAALMERGGEFIGTNLDHYGLHETFECGHHSFDGRTVRPCPADPKFPRFDEYELQFHQNPTNKQCSWVCQARPITAMAQKLPLQVSYGGTRAEAESRLRETYERYANQEHARGVRSKSHSTV